MHLEDFVTGLRRARRDNDLSSLGGLLEQAIHETPLAAQIGDPSESQVLHCESGLLVLHVVVLPGYATAPHDHRTWSMVGVYRGQEDNAFFQRLPQSAGIAQTGGRSLSDGDVMILGDGAIHSIANPRSEPLMALHVYGANIFSLERSAWDPETLEEERFDFEKHAGGEKVK